MIKIQSYNFLEFKFYTIYSTMKVQQSPSPKIKSIQTILKSHQPPQLISQMPLSYHTKPLTSNLTHKFYASTQNYPFNLSQNSSQSSSNEQNNPNDLTYLITQKKLTSENKILTYLQHFQNCHSLCPKTPKNLPQIQNISLFSPITQFVQLQQFLHKIHQNKPKYPLIQNNQKQIPIKNKISHHLKLFQQTHNQEFKKKIMNSNKIKKIHQFTSNLIVNQVLPSKNHHICEVELHLLEYKISVMILNEPTNNPLAYTIENSQSGGSGTVYFAKAFNQELAIKCIPLPEKSFIKQQYSQKISKMSSILRQYFFVMLFSQLQIGPKAKTLGGFDLVMYNDSMIFATQLCEQFLEQKSDKFQLNKSLFQMHMLRIVHRDIKPSNIMYSKAYQKPVFIDFGCTIVIRQNVGEKSWTKFVGTIDYCCQEVKRLGFNGPGYVDLYYNDIYGLKNSLGQIERKQQNFKNLGYLIQAFSKDLKYSILGLDNIYSVFELFALKHSLYLQDFKRFDFLWKESIKKYQKQAELMSKEILNFLQLKYSNGFEEIQLNQVNQNRNYTQALNEIIRGLKAKQYIFQGQLCYCKQKQYLFSEFSQIYSNIDIELGRAHQELKQLKRIILNRENIEKFIWNFKYKFSNPYLLIPPDQHPTISSLQEQIYGNIIKLCFVVANFTSFAHNNYQTSINTKIQLCSFTLNMLETHLSDKMNLFKPLFTYQVSKYAPIARFHQFYLFFILQEIDHIDKSNQICSSVLTLITLGYPFHQYSSYLKITQGLLSHTLSQELIKYLTEDEKVDRIITFWTLELIFKILSKTVSSQYQITESLLNPYSQFQQNANRLEKIILSFQLQQKKKFLNMHRIFFQKFAFMKKMDQEKIKELCGIIKSEEIKKLTMENSQYKTFWSILSSYFFISCTQKGISDQDFTMKNIERSMIFPKQSNKDLLPFLCLLFIDCSGNKGFKKRVQNRIDQIINCQDLSKKLLSRYYQRQDQTRRIKKMD